MALRLEFASVHALTLRFLGWQAEDAAAEHVINVNVGNGRIAVILGKMPGNPQCGCFVGVVQAAESNACPVRQSLADVVGHLVSRFSNQRRMGRSPIPFNGQDI